MKPENLVRQYYAQVFDENGTVTITSASLPDCKKRVNAAMSTGTPRFVTNENSNTLTIFSDAHFSGAKPIGWISEIEVPQLLSVRYLTENLLDKAA